MAPTKESRKQASDSSKIFWSDKQYDLFLEACLKGTQQNKRHHRGWGKEGFQFLVDEMSAHGHIFTQDQIKSKWDWMQKKWKLWDGLLKGETGLGWDEATGKIDASKEWWDEKVEANSKYAKVRKEGIDKKTYRIFNSLFRGKLAHGRAGCTPTSNKFPNEVASEDTDEERVVGDGSHGTFEDNENDVEVSLDNYISTGDFSTTKSNEVESINMESQNYVRKRKKKKDEATCSLGVKKGKNKKGKKKKQSGGACLAESIDNLGEILMNKAYVIADALKEPPGSSIDEVLSDILTLDEMEEGTLFWSFCVTFLMKDEVRRTYVAIKTTKGKLEFLKYNFNLGK